MHLVDSITLLSESPSGKRPVFSIFSVEILGPFKLVNFCCMFHLYESITVKTALVVWKEIIVLFVAFVQKGRLQVYGPSCTCWKECVS